MAAKEQLITLNANDISTLAYDNYRQINEQKVEEYFQSIREVGVRVAVTIKKSSNGGYSLIDGHHRVEAAKRIMTEYPHISLSIQAIVKNTDDTDSSKKDEVIHKVVSNFTRQESIIDRASGYQLLKDSGKSTKQIADTVGKDRTTIENHLHFYAMYLKHQRILDVHLPTLKDGFLYKLAHKFSRDADFDIAGAIENEISPKVKRSAAKADPESILADLGYNKSDAKKICGALRNAGIRM